MRPIGFSTGAIARGDFAAALNHLFEQRIYVVELSALRIDELEPLITAMPHLDLERFSFLSVHAPSRVSPKEEVQVTERLRWVVDRGIPVVVHPDTISAPQLWRGFDDRLLIENMDKRKPVGRTVQELLPFFQKFPAARFCFDLGHARQVDPSMTEASLLLRAFGDRLAEVHISEVNTASRHDPISPNAVRAFRSVAHYIPEHVPIILETLIADGQSDIPTEIGRAQEALSAAIAV